MKLNWAGRTHVGHVRSRNEDAILTEPPLFAVADGMGGQSAGDIAAAVTVGALSECAHGSSFNRTTVLDAIRSADAEIARRGLDQARGMGTTVTGLAAISSGTNEQSLLVFNVGDSRTYRLREGKLVQLTDDHSVVQELIDQGTITADQAATHPERNVITRSLGAGMPLDIDWWLTDAADGDRYLACSDGLFRELGPDDIVTLLEREASPDRAADTLVAAALDSGGRDNISVVVVDVVDTSDVKVSHDGADPLDDDTDPRSDGIAADTTEPIALGKEAKA